MSINVKASTSTRDPTHSHHYGLPLLVPFCVRQYAFRIYRTRIPCGLWTFEQHTRTRPKCPKQTSIKKNIGRNFSILSTHSILTGEKIIEHFERFRKKVRQHGITSAAKTSCVPFGFNAGKTNRPKKTKKAIFVVNKFVWFEMLASVWSWHITISVCSAHFSSKNQHQPPPHSPILHWRRCCAGATIDEKSRLYLNRGANQPTVGFRSH